MTVKQVNEVYDSIIEKVPELEKEYNELKKNADSDKKAIVTFETFVRQSIESGLSKNWSEQQIIQRMKDRIEEAKINPSKLWE